MKQNLEVIFGEVASDLIYTRTLQGVPVCQFTLLCPSADSPNPYRLRAIITGKNADGCAVFLEKGKEVFLRGLKSMRRIVGAQIGIQHIEELMVSDVGHLGLI